MAYVIEISDWDEHFENNRTRDMKSMAWVPIPNKMDGDGFTELLDHPAGAAHYGAWVAMVLAASRCRPRGTLLRSTKTPHDSTSLSRISRIPTSVFDEAIPRLAKIGWINRKSLPALESQEGAAKPQEGASIPHPTDYGTERNGTELNTPLIPPSDRMVRPTVEQVAAHVAEKGYHFAPEEFVAHYESNGWKVGKNPMKSWRHACVTWESSWQGKQVKPRASRLPTPEEDAAWTP